MSQTAKIELEITVDDDAAFDGESLKQVVSDELNSEFQTTDDNGEDQWVQMRVVTIDIAENGD